MKDGIYFVTFSSNKEDMGSGTVVVKDGAVNGGDFGFIYQGSASGENLKLRVVQHNPDAVSVVGDLSEFSVNFKIKSSSYGYDLSGGLEGAPQIIIDAKAKFIGDLVS